jgi:hypothetical protein
MASALVVILVLVLGVALGAFLGALGGRALLRRELGPIIANATASAGRANQAAASVESIAGEWPAILERLDQCESLSRKAAHSAQVAQQKAGNAVRLQDELERAVVGSLGISVRKVA